MITDITHKGLKKLFEDGEKSGLPAQQVKRIKTILSLLNQATEASQMAFSGSEFHPLKGTRKGVYSVKVTGHYDITFRFDKKTGNAYDVNYEDYH